MSPKRRINPIFLRCRRTTCRSIIKFFELLKLNIHDKMDNNSTQQENNEIDLLQVSNSIKKGLQNTLSFIPKTFLFIKKNILILISLLIIGGIGGFFYNRYAEKYESNIIVTPNFNSVDLLNEKIILLNSKIQQNDTIFLNKIGINKTSKITKISVKPITNLYSFLNQENNYYEIFKTLSENDDAKKVAEDPSTSKNFTNHLITINSNEKIEEKVLGNIVKYLNTSKTYEVFRIEILQNVKDKIAINASTIYQIDGILKKASLFPNNNSTISVNGDSQLNSLIQEKIKLVEEAQQLKVHQHNLKYIITPLNYSENILDISGINGKYHLIFPLILIGLFLLFSLSRKTK